jgi:hypothetical protein
VTRLAIEFEWELLGVVASDAADRLVMPAAPSAPGLYRLWAEIGPGRPWVHVGETADIRRRLAQYARPHPARGTDQRVNARLLALLDAGSRVMIWTITEALAELDGGDRLPLDLRRQSSRVILENAVLLATQSRGHARR